MKLLRNDQRQQVHDPQPAFPRKLYFLYERSTGLSFHVVAGPDGQFPMEQAAGLLAMHCVIRGQTPLDYLVMVQAPDQILKGLTERAEKLLQSWHLLSPVQLTRREEHVLNGVLRGLSNKEIAALVNLSERTVKFHVSNLFSKFHVRCRAALAREAARHTIVPVVPPSPRTSPIAAATPTLQMRPQVKQY